MDIDKFPGKFVLISVMRKKVGASKTIFVMNKIEKHPKIYINNYLETETFKIP